MFDNLKTSDKIKDQGDSLGGYILDSGLYKMAIDMAYAEKSKSGAMGLYLTFKNQAGKTLKQTIWVTGGDAKGNKHTYIDKNQEEQYLPGFSQANNICALAIGKELAAIKPEPKTIKVYNPELKKEAPMEKQVLTELLGAEIILGVTKIIENKSVKDSATNKYVDDPTGATREVNDIDKAFRAKDGLTAAEIRADETEAVFMNAWEEKNKGVTRNKVKASTPTTGATPGTPNTSQAGGIFG